MKKADIKKFKEEIKKPVQVDLKKRFYELTEKKRAGKLSETDLRALFYRALLLDDDERKVFKKYLSTKYMTKGEESRYRRLLLDHQFNKYFSKE